MKLRRYFSMTRAGMLEQLQFRLGASEKKSVKRQQTVIK